MRYIKAQGWGGGGEGGMRAIATHTIIFLFESTLAAATGTASLQKEVNKLIHIN